MERIALELHGNQCVYNVPSLLKLREAVGPVVGANLDPSHLFWMGADPLVAAEALGGAVYHVHAKDTLLNTPKQAVTASLLENGSPMDIPARSWSYTTLGFGHGEEWWRQFCCRLKMAGYDGWLSIEHEDVLLNSLEGLEKSVALLQGVMPVAASDFAAGDLVGAKRARLHLHILCVAPPVCGLRLSCVKSALLKVSAMLQDRNSPPPTLQELKRLIASRQLASRRSRTGSQGRSWKKAGNNGL